MNADVRRIAAVVLVLATAAAAGACHAVFGPSKGDDNWRAYDGPRVSLFVRPNSFAESIVPGLTELVDDQYSFTTAALGLTYGGHVAVYLYESGADAGFTNNHSGTAYPMTEAARVVCVAPFDDNLRTLVNHELNHVVIIGGLGSAGTSFVTEGLASAVLSERYGRIGRGFLYSWTRDHRGLLPRIASLMGDAVWHKTETNTAYNASASFLAYLLEIYGAQGIHQIYGAKSGELPARVADVYKKPVDSLEQEWLRFSDQAR